MKNKLLLMKLVLSTTTLLLQGMESDRSVQKVKKNKSYQAKTYKNNLEYPYLDAKIFQERHKAAAELIKDCPIIVEVGGGRNSMACHVGPTQKVIVIDPTIKKRDDERIICVPKKFEEWQGLRDLQEQRYAVVILGLALKMPDHGWNKFFEMINGSELTIIEYSTTYRDAKQQIKAILKNVNKTVISERIFDFSQEEELKDYDKVNPYRKMICLGDK
jgi:hypothetical protein